MKFTLASLLNSSQQVSSTLETKTAASAQSNKGDGRVSLSSAAVKGHISFQVGDCIFSNSENEIRQSDCLLNHLVELPSMTAFTSAAPAIIPIPQRDGRAYKHVSEFMRNGRLPDNLTFDELERLGEEAEFLCYEKLAHELAYVQEQQRVDHSVGTNSHPYALFVLGNRLYELGDIERAEHEWNLAHNLLKTTQRGWGIFTQECLLAPMSCPTKCQGILSKFHVATLTDRLCKKNNCCLR